MAKLMTGDKMIESVRKRTMAPDDISTWTDEDILDLIQEEMQVQVYDKLTELNGDNLTCTVTLPRNSTSRYPIPYRALGNGIRDISLVQGSSKIETHQIDVSEIPHFSYYSGNYNGRAIFYVQNNEIIFLNSEVSHDTVLIRYYLRPSYLTKTSRAGVISGKTKDVDAGTVTISLSSVGSTFANETSFDIVQKKTPNKIRGYDLAASMVTILTNSGTIVFSLDDFDFYDDIEVGDYLTVTGETPVPNIPSEMHPLVAQAAAIHILEATGDMQAVQIAMARLDKIVTSVQKLIDNRVAAAPKKIKPQHGALRAGKFNYKKRY